MRSPARREWRGLRPGDFGWELAGPGREANLLRRAVLKVHSEELEPGPDTVVELLQALQKVEDAVPALRRQLVAQGRVGGLSWALLGKGLGTSRTGAHNRFGDLDVEAEERSSWAEVPEALRLAEELLTEVELSEDEEDRWWLESRAWSAQALVERHRGRRPRS